MTSSLIGTSALALLVTAFGSALVAPISTGAGPMQQQNCAGLPHSEAAWRTELAALLDAQRTHLAFWIGTQRARLADRR